MVVTAQEILADGQNMDGLVVMGYHVTWRLGGVRIKRADLEQRMAEAGFASFLKRPPSAKTTLKRAIAEWANGVADDDEGGDDADEAGIPRHLIRTIDVPSQGRRVQPVIFALVRETPLVRSMGLKYATSHRFFWRPSETDPFGTVSVTSEARGPLVDDERSRVADEIAPLWEKYRDLYIARDLSGILGEIVMALDTVVMRKGGGYYFVPAARADDLARLKTLIESLPTISGRRPRLYTFPQVDGAASREQLQEMAYDTLAGQIRQAEADLEEFTAREAVKPGAVRPKTIKGLLDGYLALRKKADVLAVTTGMRQERLVADIDKLDARARALAASSPRAQRQTGTARPHPQAGTRTTPDRQARLSA